MALIGSISSIMAPKFSLGLKSLGPGDTALPSKYILGSLDHPISIPLTKLDESVKVIEDVASVPLRPPVFSQPKRTL